MAKRRQILRKKLASLFIKSVTENKDVRDRKILFNKHSVSTLFARDCRWLLEDAGTPETELNYATEMFKASSCLSFSKKLIVISFHTINVGRGRGG